MLRKIVVGIVIVGSAVTALADEPAAAQSAAPGLTAASIALSASASNGQVTLSWSYTDLTAAAQEIYRDTDPDPNGRVRVASVSSATRSFTVTGLANGTTYWFYVKNTASGVVTNSNAAQVTPTGTPAAITGSSCSTTGAETIVHATILVASGTFDGGCRRFTAGPELGDGGQAEGQDPVFRVENGATLRNVVIGQNGADGIHVYNGGTIDNVIWMNVGEDALTVKSAGTVTIRNMEGFDANDKFFQINAASTVNVSNCIIQRAGKTLRQLGGSTFTINVTFDRCDINAMNEGIFRTDSSSSTVRFTNSRIHDAGTVCIGPWRSCAQSAITTY